jgi:hypothetical protein
MKDYFNISIIAICLSISACTKAPLYESRTENSEISLDTLVTKDGCTVYRFSDAGRYHYFARCLTSTSVSSTETCGKAYVRSVEISTYNQ